MNKTISINLSGAIFNIEEDAYNHLKGYLDRIKLMFKGDPGESEIMADIESRIAELFAQKLGEKKSVILMPDVEEIIRVMGQPEDYAPGDHKEPEEKQTKNDNSHERVRNSNRRVYRDRDDAIVGGVCSGLSHYFGWDPVILRILFVVFLFVGGSALLFYLIFWIVLPAADTTAEKLQMRGESVTVENIRKFVNDEAQTASENIRNFASRNKPDAFVSQAGHILKRLIGALLILIGTAFLISMITAIIVADINILGDGHANYDLINQLIFADNSTLTLLIIGASLVMAIPAIALVYIGIRMAFDIRKRVPGMGLAMLLLFITGLIISAIGGVKTGRQFAYDADIRTEINADPVESDTLMVEVNDDLYFENFTKDEHKELWQMIKIDGDTVIYGAPVHLEFYDDYYGENSKNIEVSVVKQSNGSSRQEAYRLAEDIKYSYTIEGNVLKLDPVFSTAKANLYRGQEVTIRINVPTGKSIAFGKNIGRLNWHDEFEGKIMRMDPDGWAQATPVK